MMTSTATTRVVTLGSRYGLLVIGVLVFASLSAETVRAQAAVILCQSVAGNLRAAATSCRPDETRTDVMTLFLRPFDARFSIMWRKFDGTTENAVIRAGGSIRTSTDADLVVDKIGVGEYCLTPGIGSLEGAVAVLQKVSTSSPNPPGVIHVTAGIGSFCEGGGYYVTTFRF